MATRNEKKFNFSNVLNSYLAESDTFSKLFEAVGKVTDDLVQEKITQLARVRDPRIVHRGDYIDTPKGRGHVSYVKRVEHPEIIDEVHADVPGVGSVVVNMRSLQDRTILINGAKYVGFNYFSDTLTDDDYARVMQFVSEYWPLASGDTFVNFMGYINRIRLDITQLWSLDEPDTDTYPFLEERNGMTSFPVWEGGQAFPTSHVALTYDASDNVTPGKLANLAMLFYYLAPVHLVLERIIGEISGEIGYSYAAVGDLFFSNSAYMDLNKYTAPQTIFSNPGNSQYVPLI